MAYFMISVDDPQTNKEFAESLDSDFPLLSNPTKEVAEAYGVVTAERALPYRWTHDGTGDRLAEASFRQSTKRTQAPRLGPFGAPLKSLTPESVRRPETVPFPYPSFVLLRP